MHHSSALTTKGFTLIEMSIVLVIIGLIIGGILVGRDLIAASAVNAQIAQITKYNSAVNTFRNKYGGLPGDLQLNLANQFGFTTTSCDGTDALRDGDGLIEARQSIDPPLQQNLNEVAFFWQDLSNAHLIEGNLDSAVTACTPGAGGPGTLTLAAGSSYIGNFLPEGKIGYGNFVYVYTNNGANWLGIVSVKLMAAGTSLTNSAGTIPVVAAYNIDKKMDDGLPTSGTVIANYVHVTTLTLATNNTNDDTTTCYNTTTNTYSLSASANGGSGLNCALSFKFQ